MQTRFWQIQDGRFLLVLPGIGRFLAVDGRELHLDPAPGSDPADALPFVLGTGIGVILHQRGIMVLHASTVERDGRAYAFCGQSGIGKSTLAAALCREGCRLVADDLSTVALGDDRHPAVQPDGRMLKLFPRTITQLELDSHQHGAVRHTDGKYYVSPSSGTSSGPIPLAAIYLLRRQPQTIPREVKRVSPLVAAQMLLEDTYRRRLALAYAGEGKLVALTAQVVQQVPISILAQSHDFANLTDTIAALRVHWDALER